MSNHSTDDRYGQFVVSIPPYRRVLLVDDEPISRKIVLTILEKLGITADTAASGAEAVRLIAEVRYDAVLMDLRMPEMNGYEATELIRRREKEHASGRTVIIAMTANIMESTVQRCFEAGMDDLITKPVQPAMLAEHLQRWLTAEDSGPAAHRSVSQEQRRAEFVSPASDRPEWRPDTALSFVGGDEGLLLDLVALFLTRHEGLLAAIEDAVQAQDAQGLRNTAHAYKGAVSHLAAEEIRAIAADLEEAGRYGRLEAASEMVSRLRGLSSQLLRDLDAYLRESRTDS